MSINYVINMDVEDLELHRVALELYHTRLQTQHYDMTRELEVGRVWMSDDQIEEFTQETEETYKLMAHTRKTISYYEDLISMEGEEPDTHYECTCGAGDNAEVHNSKCTFYEEG